MRRHLILALTVAAPALADSFTTAGAGLQIQNVPLFNPGGAVHTLGGVPQAVGGTADHVHMLVGLRATHCLADVLREIKRPSSQWVHETLGVAEFAWQEGYGAFTVSESNVEQVRCYIANQREHHRHKTFQEEFVEFLKVYGVPYDERYIWD